MVPVDALVSGALADINPVLESGILAHATPVRVPATMVQAHVTLVLVSGVLVAKPVPVSMSGVMCNPGSVVLFVVHNLELSLIPQSLLRQDCPLVSTEFLQQFCAPAGLLQQSCASELHQICSCLPEVMESLVNWFPLSCFLWQSSSPDPSPSSGTNSLL